MSEVRRGAGVAGNLYVGHAMDRSGIRPWGMRMRRLVLTLISITVVWGAGETAAAQQAAPLSRETFDPSLLPSPGLLRLADEPPALSDGPIIEGQVFLSIPVRHAITAMSSPGREVDVVYRRGRPRGRPNRPSEVLPTPAPFFLSVLSDSESGVPVFYWCTPGEGLRAGPMCTSGSLDSGVVRADGGLGSRMIENHGNPYLPTSLRFRTCVSGCSTAWMHLISLYSNNQPIRENLALEYVLGSIDASGARTIQRRLGGQPLDSVRVPSNTELRTAAGAISFVVDGTGVRVRLRSFSDAERARSLAVLVATFRQLQVRRDATMGSGPGNVAAAGAPTGVGSGTLVLPMTEVFTQPVTLPGRDMAFPEGQGPNLFIDYLGAIGDVWDADRDYFRPRYAWFVFGYARRAAGRWHLVVPVDERSGGGVVLAGRTVLRVAELDENGAARIEVVGGVPAEPTALR